MSLNYYNLDNELDLWAAAQLHGDTYDCPECKKGIIVQLDAPERVKLEIVTLDDYSERIRK
jgi:hypothetical protein